MSALRIAVVGTAAALAMAGPSSIPEARAQTAAPGIYNYMLESSDGQVTCMRKARAVARRTGVTTSDVTTSVLMFNNQTGRSWMIRCDVSGYVVFIVAGAGSSEELVEDDCRLRDLYATS